MKKVKEQHFIDWEKFSFRHAVVVLLNSKIYLTDEYDPWRLFFCQTGLNLYAVALTFRVVFSKKANEAFVTSSHKFMA